MTKEIVKMCTKCGVKPMYLKAKYPSYCSDCKLEANRITYAKKNDIENKYNNARRNYNLSKKDFLLLIKKRQCNICQKKLSLKEINIDHCHTTKKVRGILCQSCNYGLGFFKDNKSLLVRAVDYLNESNQLSFLE